MRFSYGEKNLLRVLEETEFWKRQETEHTVVIREIVVNLEAGFVRLLQEWEQSLAYTGGVAVKYIESVIRSNYNLSPQLEQEIIVFISQSIEQSQKFIGTLNYIAAQSGAVKNNAAAQVVINHIRRESEYFIGIAQVIISRT